MEKNNSIINSLKRLERVGDETSRVTEKLKNAACEVANKIYGMVIDYRREYRAHEIMKYTRITGANKQPGLFIVETSGGVCLAYDYDTEMHEYNYQDYILSSDMHRDMALRFSKLIANGVLDKIVDWLEKKKKKGQEAIEVLEKKK